MTVDRGTGIGATGSPGDEEENDAAAAKNQSRWFALNRHFNEVPAPSLGTLSDLMAEVGTDVAKLARRLDIGAAVLEAVVAGVVPGLPKPRLLRALAYELGVPYETVARAVMAAAASFARSKREGLAKPTPPTGSIQPRRPSGEAARLIKSRPQTFADLVKRSSMSHEQKTYWLGDD